MCNLILASRDITKVDPLKPPRQIENLLLKIAIARGARTKAFPKFSSHRVVIGSNPDSREASVSRDFKGAENRCGVRVVRRGTAV